MRALDYPKPYLIKFSHLLNCRDQDNREHEDLSQKNNHIKEALEVSGLSMEHLQKYGKPPELAMKKFDEWVRAIQGRPVFVAFNATFDWSFVNYYFYKYVGNNPFRISGLAL